MTHFPFSCYRLFPLAVGSAAMIVYGPTEAVTAVVGRHKAAGGSVLHAGYSQTLPNIRKRAWKEESTPWPLFIGGCWVTGHAEAYDDFLAQFYAPKAET